MRAAALVAAATAAFVIAPSAAGHGSVQPTAAEPGATERFTFQVLNPRETPMVGFQLSVPRGATVVDVPPKPRWQAFQLGGVVAWRGSAPARGSESFEVVVRLPRNEGTVSFTGNEVFVGGEGPQFRLDVVLAQGAAKGDDGIGALEVFAAIGIAVLVMAAGLLARARRRAEKRR